MYLRSIYRRFKELELPSAPSEEKFENWIFDANEVVAFYAGIIHSAVGGPPIRIDLSTLDELSNGLSQLEVLEQDPGVLESCKSYASQIRILLEEVNRGSDLGRDLSNSILGRVRRSIFWFTE